MTSDGILDREFDAVSLDLGGVMVWPDHGILAFALRRQGIPFEYQRFGEAHYYGMAEVDRSYAEPETFRSYNVGFVQAAGVPEENIEQAVAVFDEVLVPPLWHQRIPGAVDAAGRLATSGLRLGVTSNADGSIEDSLRRHEIMQVGPGPGVELEHMTDSGILGVHKPDPACFMHTVEGLGLPPERICHVGDSARFDAEGAAALGMVAVHVDPLKWCSGDHHHVGSLAEFADIVEVQGSRGGSS